MDNKKINITDELLVSYLLSETNEQQTKQVDDWLKEDLANSHYFEQFQKTWQLAAKIDFQDIDFDTNKAWLNVEQQLTNKTILLSNKSNLHYWAMGIAASVLFLVALFFIFYPTKHTQFVFENNTQSPISNTLKDGSIVVVNPNSKIVFDTKQKDKRYCKLQGKANFQVAKDEKKPFVVEVENTLIQVVGTIFTVNSNLSDTTILVYVEQGNVRVTTKQDTVVLARSQKAEINKQTGKINLSFGQVEPYFTEYVKDRKFYFNAVDMKEVIDTLSKSYNIEISIDQNLWDKKLTATFENENIETILQIISMTFEIEVQKQGRVYKIIKK